MDRSAMAMRSAMEPGDLGSSSPTDHGPPSGWLPMARMRRLEVDLKNGVAAERRPLPHAQLRRRDSRRKRQQRQTGGGGGYANEAAARNDHGRSPDVEPRM